MLGEYTWSDWTIKQGINGENGVTFTPNIDNDGNLSWTNNGNLDNPTTINIKGPKGDTGIQGPTGSQGPKGETGATGENGSDGQDGYTPIRGTDYWTTADIQAIHDYCDSLFQSEITNAIGGEY